MAIFDMGKKCLGTYSVSGFNSASKFSLAIRLGFCSRRTHPGLYRSPSSPTWKRVGGAMQTRWARFTSTKSSVMPFTLIKSSNLLNERVIGIRHTHLSFYTTRRRFSISRTWLMLVHQLPHSPSKWMAARLLSSLYDRVCVPPAHGG